MYEFTFPNPCNSKALIRMGRMQAMYYKRNEDFITREIAGETILVPTGQAARSLNGMINLNPTGVLLWSALKEPQTPERLAGLVTKEYDIDASAALSDVMGFLEKAESRGLVLRV